MTTVTIPAQRPAPDDRHAEMWALVERAQAGDPEAVAAIYARYLDTVFRFIHYRVGSRPLAEDLTADTFLRALKRIGTFTYQGRDLGAWLITIARNLVADHYGSGRYRLEVATAEVLDVDQADADRQGSPESVAVTTAAAVAVHAAFRHLTAEQEQVLRLRYFDGLDVGETAEAIGKNDGAVKALTYRAIQTLRRLAPELEALR